jgi:hypothetical protein
MRGTMHREIFILTFIVAQNLLQNVSEHQDNNSSSFWDLSGRRPVSVDPQPDRITYEGVSKTF